MVGEMCIHITMFVSFLFSLFSIAQAYTSLAINDKVNNLPSIVNGASNFSLFSGYLSLPTQILTSTSFNTHSTKSFQPENKIIKMIHYLYVESQSDPENDPIIIWTNGGPGCSGLVGFFTEMGPWRPMKDESENIILVDNPYAWNRHANIVFLEQPVGVGFSYIIDDNPEIIGDQSSVEDILDAIIQFFLRFPERKSNPLYFASESYGGHYIPELTLQLFKSSETDMKNQLKGLLIGNPFVSFGTGFLSRGIAFWNFQLIPRSLWLQYQANECDNMDLSVDEFPEACWDILNSMFDKASPYLDYYGANFPTCNATDTSIDTSSSWEIPMKILSTSIDHSRSKHHAIKKNLKNLLHFRQSPHFIRQLRRTTSQRQLEDSREWFDDDNEDSIGYVECSPLYMEEYLNRQDVKLALHVETSIDWIECNDRIFYDWPLNDLFGNKIPLYREILQNNTQLDVLIFSGDNDIICPTIGTQHWIFGLGLEVKRLWRPWRRLNQTAGYLTQFSQKLSFLTIHSAGHMVPRYQPGRGYEVISRYLNGDWFQSSAEGLVLSCGYLVVIEDFYHHTSGTTEQFVYLDWAIRYLFESFSLKYLNESIDIWNIEIIDLEGTDISDDDDDSARSWQKLSHHRHSHHHRLLKKHHQPIITSSTHKLLIILEVVIPNFEIGVTLKTTLDTFFEVSMSYQYQHFLQILRFTYLEQFKYYNINMDSFFLQLDFYGMKILTHQVFSGYSMDLLSLSSRPKRSKELVYYSTNITWNNLEKILNSTAIDEESTSSSEEYDPWYHHLLILTSDLDAGDILLLLFLPIGILFGALFLFQTYQSVHDRFLNEMGYEIQYEVHDSSENDVSYNPTQQTATTTRNNNSLSEQNQTQSQIEMGTYRR